MEKKEQETYIVEGLWIVPPVPVVYVVELCTYPDDHVIQGIFSTRAKAEQEAQKVRNQGATAEVGEWPVDGVWDGQ